MEKPTKRTICFFDSGIGGLWLLLRCVQKLPDIDFIYFSDNKNVPYGSLSINRLIELADGVFEKMSTHNPAAAVIACNTVTASCIDYLRNKYKFEIIGIQPAIKPAVKVGGTCLVLATPSTAESKALSELIKKYGDGRVVVYPCRNLAQYIEENYKNIDENFVNSLLPDEKCQSVVLGCTHYIYIKDIIKRRYSCPVFDGIDGTAERLVEKSGTCDHCARGQMITFSGGDEDKNRRVFNKLLFDNWLKTL